MKRIKEEVVTKFVEDLNVGILKELLDKIKNDDTLELEFRDKYISIYYRGGSISKIELKNDNCYEEYFNNNYRKFNEKILEEEEEENMQLQMKIENDEDCQKLVKEIIKRKEEMNCFFSKNPKREREYQQLVERENNDRGDSNYYIADIEYAKDDSRFDMISVQRKDRDDYLKLKLAIIEMKYGEKAIGNNCGIYDHYCDIKKLSTETIKDIIEDAEIIMKYKYELGLIKTTKYIDRGVKINKVDEIDFIFFISGITQKHNKTLLEDLKKIKNDINSDEEFKNREIKINIKIFSPYMAGNIMFDKDIISIDEFMALTEYKKNDFC